MRTLLGAIFPRCDMQRVLWCALLLGGLAACSSSSSETDPAEADAGAGDATTDTLGDSGADGSGSETDAGSTVPGADQAVRVMRGEDVFFTGAENRREVYTTATLPPANETYASINLHFALSCPDGACDPWDRLGSFGIIDGRQTDEPLYIELSRFITPYRVGAEWDVDVTDLRPLLQGDVEFYAFIDTWVGPGSGFGNGWTVTATLEFTGGVPAREAIAVLPVTNGRLRVAYGNPDVPVADQFVPVEVTVPQGATSLGLRTFITGHGQGNADNCAEFCPRVHTWIVDDVEFDAEIWRDDCETTAAPDQQGTWQYPRAGWCPGAKAHDWTEQDLTVPADGTVTVAYAVEEYENTCRPEADPCTGCSLGNGCEWNDSNHTEPNYQVSAVVIAYR